MQLITKLSPLLFAVLVSACAGTNTIELTQAIEEQAQREQLSLPATDPAQRSQVQQEVQRLLAEPLSLQSASRIAVLNNPGFMAALSGLAISQADLEQAALLPNPGVRVIRSREDHGYNTELDFSLNLFNLIFFSQNKAIALEQAKQQQQQVALQLVDLLAQSRSAYLEAVAAEQQFNYLQQVQEALDASAELANRMYQAGNYSELQQARQLKYVAEVKLQLARSQQQQLQSRERLYRQLGLWGEQINLRLPEHLDPVPDQLVQAEQAEQLAMMQRLDLQQAKQRLSMLEKRLKLDKNSRFIRGLSAEIAGSTQDSQERELALGIELPLFDQGSTRISKAEAEYMQAWWQAQSLAVQARSEVREAHSQLQSQHQIALHYQKHLVPLAKKINQQNLLRYNGMLIGVFELIAETQAQVDTVIAQIAAQRDFYLAQLRLQQALWGRVSVPSAEDTPKNTATTAAGH